VAILAGRGYLAVAPSRPPRASCSAKGPDTRTTRRPVASTGADVTDLSQDPVFVQPFLDSCACELGVRAGQQDPRGVEITVGFVWVA
jgi:hypothetical protein